MWATPRSTLRRCKAICSAPFGYRCVSRHAGSATAQLEVVEDEAQMFCGMSEIADCARPPRHRDLRFGEPMRRRRPLSVSAFAPALLTHLGPMAESLGMDRLLKSNTSKKRTHSLFREPLHAFTT